MKASLMGLFETNPFSFPGVNAWATQSVQVGALPIEVHFVLDERGRRKQLADRVCGVTVKALSRRQEAR